MTCNRVIILHEGRILAADTTENLRRRLSGDSQIIAEIAAPLLDLRSCWDQMAEVDHFEVVPVDGDYFRCSLTPRNGADLRSLVFDQAHARAWRLRELTRSQHTLEDIFVHITRAERDEEEEI